MLFFLWLHLFIIPGAIFPLFSSSILGTYLPGEFIFKCHLFLPFHPVHRVLKVRILKWFVTSFSSGPHFVRTLQHDSSVLGGPMWYGLFSSVQSLSHVQLFATPWIAAHQASLSITNSRSLLKLMSSKSVMPSSHLIFCHPLLLLPPIPPSIRVFSNESTLRMRWPKYWSFSFSISPSNEHLGLISFRMDWLGLLAVSQDSQESSPTPQFKSINFSALSFLHSPTLTSIHDH